MPIRSVKEIEARRAAKAAAEKSEKAEAAPQPLLDPPPVARTYETRQEARARNQE